MVLTGVGEMCKYAQSAPKGKTTGNEVADRIIRNQHKALQQTVDILVKRPHLRQEVWEYTSSLAQKEDSAVEKDVEKDISVEFPVTLAKSEDGFMCGFIAQQTKLSVEQVGKVKSVMRANILRLFLVLLQAMGGLKNAAACRSRMVYGYACKARANSLDHWLKDLTVDGLRVTEAGKINWGSVGFYSYEVASNKLSTVKHNPTGDVIDISAEEISGNPGEIEFLTHWTENAELKFGKKRLSLIDLFPKEPKKGPHKSKVIMSNSAVWNRIVENAAAEVKKAAGALSENSLEVDSEELQKAAKEKLKNHHQRIQQKMAEKT